MRAKQLNRYRIQACRLPCTSGSRRPRGVVDGILQVGICQGSPRPGRRGGSRGAGVPSGLRDFGMVCVPVREGRVGGGAFSGFLKKPVCLGVRNQSLDIRKTNDCVDELGCTLGSP